jgi:hypothetical protein
MRGKVRHLLQRAWARPRGFVHHHPYAYEPPPRRPRLRTWERRHREPPEMAAFPGGAPDSAGPLVKTRLPYGCCWSRFTTGAKYAIVMMLVGSSNIYLITLITIWLSSRATCGIGCERGAWLSRLAGIFARLGSAAASRQRDSLCPILMAGATGNRASPGSC